MANRVSKYTLRPTEMVDAYAARFRKAISKVEMGNLLPA